MNGRVSVESVVLIDHGPYRCAFEVTEVRLQSAQGISIHSLVKAGRGCNHSRLVGFNGLLLKSFATRKRNPILGKVRLYIRPVLQILSLQLRPPACSLRTAALNSRIGAMPSVSPEGSRTEQLQGNAPSWMVILFRLVPGLGSDAREEFILPVKRSLREVLVTASLIGGYTSSSGGNEHGSQVPWPFFTAIKLISLIP